MRSQGQVRFIKVSTKVQTLGAVGVVSFLSVWVGTMASATLSQWSAMQEQAALQAREARIATAQNRVDAYRQDVRAVAADLERRQEFIQRMVEAHLGDLPDDIQGGDAASDDRDETSTTVKKLSMAMPEAAQLAQLEAAQLSFVERLTRYADRRSTRAADSIRKLGLNPGAMIARRSAEGGPLLRLATARDGSVDPRFRRMGASLARMDAMVSSLASVPQVQPAHVPFVSSSFGYRADPFNGGAAFHAGLDFPGPMGSAIYAAAKGRVTFVGQKQGYGNCIEISHGSGLVTRYAHLSGFGARVGQMVEPGTRIAAMGSTGRSTGPHLHFEVRINDQPVNPRPFLDAAQKAQARS
ncbi:murein DD-endopeptidase MepM/ murein hydrolase activator NlpD [Novosphingobium fluoreni]|uniref:Murein DD-endopeptidase MepM/ murein hydrolase activator NlpD n=1 Tax=Novosphingobium fluoreni TaxID=1391222 RepID=A0A7W6BW31_9SPHN|nr:M23 family metallopeptidase [Novosphingobium fluoreni]MBB3938978.1 murein DD-endopeptidase MepM/ murein hydrolase activator NlpD [Novosphingobium fluoreni]